MMEKLKTLLQDEEFAKKLFSLESDTEIQSFLAENGVEFSLEEVAAMKAAVKARLENGDEELSEDMLENVAGGSALSDLGDVLKFMFDGFGDSMKELFTRW